MVDHNRPKLGTYIDLSMFYLHIHWNFLYFVVVNFRRKLLKSLLLKIFYILSRNFTSICGDFVCLVHQTSKFSKEPRQITTVGDILVGCLVTATYNTVPISKMSSDFEMSKTKNVFQTILPSSLHLTGHLQKFTKFKKSIDFKNSKTKMCFRPFLDPSGIPMNRTKVHQISKFFEPKCIFKDSKQLTLPRKLLPPPPPPLLSQPEKNQIGCDTMLISYSQSYG